MSRQWISSVGVLALLLALASAPGCGSSSDNDDSGVDSGHPDQGSELCEENERVQDYECVPCAAGSLNAAGDDPAGADTECESDACSTVLGVLCGTFEEADIKASNTDLEDSFGGAVALSGDTLAVGAYGEDSNATGVDGDEENDDLLSAGAVYVFVRDTAGVWRQQAYLKPETPAASGFFGGALALSGDTLAVGAYGESSNTGAVYVFQRDAGGEWTQEERLTAEHGEAGDLFGVTLALSGSTLAVAAREEDSAAMGVDGDQTNNDAAVSGAVYVFERSSGGDWSQDAYIKASHPGANDRFGGSLALDGDVLAVGAYTEDSNATDIDGDETNDDANSSGAVYVFHRDGAGEWAQEAYIKASNTDADDYFGISVAVAGDTLAVSASGEASNATTVGGDQGNDDASRAGAVYVFRRSNAGVWAQEAYLKASNTEEDDLFGASVAIVGELVAVGAAEEGGGTTGLEGDDSNNDASDSGAVFLFRRSAGVWTQLAYIKASNTGENDYFGYALALSSDTLAVASFGEDSAAEGIDQDMSDDDAEESGAVYVRRIAP